jgi:hypothetical protein
MACRDVFCTLTLMLAAFASARGDCIVLTAAQAFARADVVLSGEVVDVHRVQRDILTEILQPPKWTAVIRVSRVWKGAVGKTFELAWTTYLNGRGDP